MTSLQSSLKHWIVFIAIFLFRSDEEDLSKKEKPVFISNNVKCILLGILEPELPSTHIRAGFTVHCKLFIINNYKYTAN